MLLSYRNYCKTLKINTARYLRKTAITRPDIAITFMTTG